MYIVIINRYIGLYNIELCKKTNGGKTKTIDQNNNYELFVKDFHQCYF